MQIFLIWSISDPILNVKTVLQIQIIYYNAYNELKLYNVNTKVIYALQITAIKLSFNTDCCIYMQI